MTTSRAILKADACSLLLVDEETQELVFEVAQGPVADKLKGGFRLEKGEGIAGAIRCCLQDPSTCVRRAMGGRAQVEDAYHPARQMEKVFALFDRLCHT